MTNLNGLFFKKRVVRQLFQIEPHKKQLRQLGIFFCNLIIVKCLIYPPLARNPLGEILWRQICRFVAKHGVNQGRRLFDGWFFQRSMVNALRLQRFTVTNPIAHIYLIN